MFRVNARNMNNDGLPVKHFGKALSVGHAFNETVARSQGDCNTRTDFISIP